MGIIQALFAHCVSKYIQLSLSIEAVSRVVTPILKWYSDVIFSNRRQNQIRHDASVRKLPIIHWHTENIISHSSLAPFSLFLDSFSNFLILC